MKMPRPHIKALSKQAIAILEEQKRYTGSFKYVFHSMEAKDGHIVTNTLLKNIHNSGYVGKWTDKVTTHGFRSTFRTICSKNETDLLKICIGEKAIEDYMAHSEKEVVVQSYERERASLETKRKLAEWYADKLENLYPLYSTQIN